MPVYHPDGGLREETLRRPEEGRRSMMNADRQQDRISFADWLEWYSNPAVWPVSRHVFLAEAAMRLGRSMILPWEDRLLSHAGEAMLPLPHGLSWTPPDRPRFADRSGVVTIDVAVKDGLARPAGWTDDDEMHLYDADTHNSVRHDARLAVNAIANALAKLAARGSIRTYARLIGGGPLEEIEPADWEIDDPVGRLASCRLTPGLPSAEPSTGTHLIFVEAEALTKKLTVYAREKPLALNSGHAVPLDHARSRPTQRDRLVARCEDAMRDYLRKGPSDWRKDTLRQVVDKAINRPFSDSVFDQARENVKEEFGHIGKGGRPKGS